MFEKEIEFIYNYYLNKIEKLNSFVTFDQLASANLHPALLQYVSAEIDYLIFEDRQKLLKESLFDYSGDQINDHFNQISEEIKQTKKFSKEYISKLLLHATSFNVNYVVRPNWSLLQFIFENEDEKNVSEVKQILNYLYYYPYYKRILINFFNQKHLYKISEDELISVLDKIDKINIENNFEEIVNESLSNIVDFINIGEIGNNRISKDVIEYFLIDKNFAEPSKVLAEKLSSSSDDKFKIEEYKEIILSLLDVVDEQVIQPDEEEQINEESSEVEEDTTTQEELSNEENENEKNLVEDNLQIDDESKSDIEESLIVEHDEITVIDPDELVDSNELEPPEFDEDPRIEDTDLQEVYDMVVEEEDIDDIELDENDGERLNIGDDEADDSYLKELDKLEEIIETSNEESIIEENSEAINEDDYIIQGSSVSLSADNIDDYESLKPDEEIEESEIIESSDSNESFDEADLNEEEELLEETNDEVSVSIIEEPAQENLSFGETEESYTQNDDVEIKDEPESEAPKLQVIKRDIDIEKLLKNRKVSKIIENVFDYDMDEFTKTIEKISICASKEEALLIIEDIAHGSFLDESSREIRNFKKIISDLF